MTGERYWQMTVLRMLNFYTFKFCFNSRDIQNCLSKCCSTKDCDMAYLVNHQQCFSVKCFTPELCQIADEPLKHRMIEISKLIKAKKKRRIKRSKLFEGMINQFSTDINLFFESIAPIILQCFPEFPRNCYRILEAIEIKGNIGSTTPDHIIRSILNPLSVNPTKSSKHSNNLPVIADELFDKWK